MAHVNDGTSDKGRRVVRPRAKDWVCPECQKALRYYWVSCPTDGTRRPEQT